MSRWRQTLESAREFREFMKLVGALFQKADDKTALARALNNGEFETAAREAGMTQQEFADHVCDLERLGQQLVDDDDVADALDQYDQEPCEPASS